jgi:hypothetical protein
MAEITPICRHPRLMPVKGRRMVVKVIGIGGGWQTPRNDAGRQRAVGQGRSPCLLFFFTEALPQAPFFIKR